MERIMGGPLSAEGRTSLEGATAGARQTLLKKVADLLHHKLGRSADAVPHLRAILEDSPKDRDIQRSLVAVYESIEEYSEAAKVLLVLARELGRCGRGDGLAGSRVMTILLRRRTCIRASLRCAPSVPERILMTTTPHL